MPENYLVIGDDDFIRRRETDRIKNKHLTPGGSGFEYSLFTPENSYELINTLNTLTFFSETRIVVFKEAEKSDNSVLEDIVKYLAQPLSTTVLIISSGSSLKKNRFYKEITAHVKVIKADKPDRATLKKWIKTFFNNENVSISPDAVELIIELKGSDPEGVRSELEKVLNYSDGAGIGAGDVEKLVGRSITETVFKLVDAVNTKNPGWAFRILGDLYDQKKTPAEILGYLGWYMRTIQTIKLMLSRGETPGAIAAETGYSAGYISRLIGQSRKYTPEKVEQWICFLYSSDREIKKGLKQPRLALEMLISRFTRKNSGKDYALI